jgi:hypothetical protein
MIKRSDYLAQCVVGTFDMVKRTPEWAAYDGGFTRTPAWRLMGHSLDLCLAADTNGRLLPAPAPEQPS